MYSKFQFFLFGFNFHHGNIQSCHDWSPFIQNPHGSFNGSESNTFGFTTPDYPVGRYDLRLECAHMDQPSLIFLAFSLALSMFPTMKNACSGRSSHFPLRISSKLLTLSAIETYSPATPVNLSATQLGCPKNL